MGLPLVEKTIFQTGQKWFLHAKLTGLPKKVCKNCSFSMRVTHPHAKRVLMSPSCKNEIPKKNKKCKKKILALLLDPNGARRPPLDPGRHALSPPSARSTHGSRHSHLRSTGEPTAVLLLCHPPPAVNRAARHPSRGRRRQIRLPPEDTSWLQPWSLRTRRPFWEATRWDEPNSLLSHCYFAAL